MGFFSGDRNDGEPSLGEAWQMLAARMGIAVEERGTTSVRAEGTVRGRGFFVDIDGDQKGSDLLRPFAYNPRGGSRVHIRWRSELAVARANPNGLQGIIASYVDVHHPDWDPRNYDPRHGRIVGTDPPDLAAKVLTASVHEQLMSIRGDVRITIEPAAVRLIDEGKSDVDGGFMIGSILHQASGPIVPWPDRALVGPPWWTLLLCEIAEAADA